MEHKDVKANGTKTRSFRYEDYNTRRVFLRSYPLQWDAEENRDNEEISRMNQENSSKKKPIKKIVNSEKKPMKQIILSIIHWGEGKAVVLRRFKDKFTVYVIACIPPNFKPCRALISA